MKLLGIVAMTGERVMGKDGMLPWHLPGDLPFFKRTTMGHPVVMGRKTHESIGRALPGRRNIVLSRQNVTLGPGLEVIHTPEELEELGLEGEVYIIGGAEVFRLFLAWMDELLVTHVARSYPGDTYFPEFEEQFELVETIREEREFRICRYRRRG